MQLVRVVLLLREYDVLMNNRLRLRMPTSSNAPQMVITSDPLNVMETVGRSLPNIPVSDEDSKLWQDQRLSTI